MFEYEFGVIRLTTFLCRLRAGTPEPTEHANIRWLAPADLDTVAWAPADLPAVERIRSQLETPG